MRSHNNLVPDHTAADHCGKGHCRVLPLEDGASGYTPDGRCRRCVRARQNRWTRTEKARAVRARHETRAARFLSRARYNASVRGL